MTSRHPAVSCACPKCQSERRTTPPPTPATDANPFVGTNWQVRADTPATDTPGTYGTMTPTIEVVPPHYPLATEEREAVAHAIELCATPYISEALAECALSALAQIRAAEILAAEANVTARIVAWLRATSTGLDLTKRRIADAIERNEHGAGK